MMIGQKMFLFFFRKYKNNRSLIRQTSLSAIALLQLSGIFNPAFKSPGFLILISNNLKSLLKI